MKRLDVEVPVDEEIDESRNEFIPNRTITIGKTQYQVYHFEQIEFFCSEKNTKVI